MPACFKTPKQQDNYKKQMAFMIEKRFIQPRLLSGLVFSGDPFMNDEPMHPVVVPRLGADNIQLWHNMCPRALEVSCASRLPQCAMVVFLCSRARAQPLQH